MKLHDMRSQQEEFKRRSRDRSNRMNGLVQLFQSGEIDVRRFRHLANLLKVEHRTDCRESGVKVDSQFK